MSAITLLKTYECAGGDPVTDEEKEIFLRLLLKIGKKTRTKAQLKTLLNNGWTVTI